MCRRQVTAALFSLVLSLAISLTTLFAPPPAMAAKLSVPQRIERLTKDIDAARAVEELTTEQQQNLKDELTAVNEKVQKIKEKNDGKLTEQDSKKLHKTLNEISIRIFQLRLDNIYG